MTKVAVADVLTDADLLFNEDALLSLSLLFFLNLQGIL
jgi:hypothetical protein